MLKVYRTWRVVDGEPACDERGALFLALPRIESIEAVTGECDRWASVVSTGGLSYYVPVEAHLLADLVTFVRTSSETSMESAITADDARAFAESKRIGGVA